MVVFLLASSSHSRLLLQEPRLQLQPPSLGPPHTPCGLETALLQAASVLWAGKAAKPGCRHRHISGALSLRWPAGALRLPGDPSSPARSATKASGVPIGTTVSQCGRGYSLYQNTLVPSTPDSFPLPPGTALRSRNIPYPGARGEGGGSSVFPELSQGKVLAESPSSLPRTGVSRSTAWVGFSGPSKRTSPGTRQLPGRAWAALPGWS